MIYIYYQPHRILEDYRTQRKTVTTYILATNVFKLNSGLELVALLYTFQMAEDEAEHLVHRVTCVNSAQMNAATLPRIALEAFSSELDLINSFYRRLGSRYYNRMGC